MNSTTLNCSKQNIQILTIREVSKITTLSVPTIYRVLKSPTYGFPMLIALSPNRSGFMAHEIYIWLESKKVNSIKALQQIAGDK